MKKTLAVVVMFCLMEASFALSSTLFSTQDTNISSGEFSDSNMHTGEYLTINWWDQSKNSGLVQFDLSSFFGNFSIANLDIYHNFNYSYGATFEIFRNTESWNSTTVTWNNSPSYEVTPFGTLVISDSSAEVWRTVDITSLVSGWLDGIYGNFGLRIQRMDQDNPYVYFASSNKEGFGPKLQLTDSEANPVPEPATMLLFGTGIARLAAARRRKKAC